MSSSRRASRTRIYTWLRFTFRFVGRLGFGRQGALAATRRMFPVRALSPARKALSLLVGSTLIGVGVVLLTEARLGLSPYDVLVSGLLPIVGLSFGQTVWLVSAILFLVAFALGQRPTIWGIGYVLGIGVAIDSISGSINSPDTLLGRSVFVGAALLILSVGISLVVHSGSTGGAFELLMKAGEERGFDRRKVRTSLELGVLMLGIGLGGSIGPATLVIALGIGPLLGVTGQALADHSHGRARRRIAESPYSLHPSAMASSRS